MKSTRDFRRRTGGGVAEDLLRTARDLARGTLLDSMNDVVRQVVHRSMMSTLLYALSGILLGAGFLLLLAGAFEALKRVPLPEAAAFAIVGVLALGGGIAAVAAAQSRNRS